MRLVPSHQNTGGFFVAVLKKVKPFNMNPTKVQMVLAKDPFAVVDVAMAEPDEVAAPAPEEAKSDEPCRIFEKFGRCKYGAACKYQHVESGDGKVQVRSGTSGEEPLRPLTVDHFEVVDKLQRAFGLGSDFPTTQLFTRSKSDTTKPRNISYVSESITDMLECDVRGRLHVINCGIKAFERVELKDPIVIAPYRVCQEMTHTLLPHMKKRKVQCGVRTFQSLLLKSQHTIEDMATFDFDSPTPLVDQLKAVDIGTIIIYAEYNGESFISSAFLGKQTVQLYIGKDESATYKNQLQSMFGDPKAPAATSKESTPIISNTTAVVEGSPKKPLHVQFE